MPRSSRGLASRGAFVRLEVGSSIGLICNRQAWLLAGMVDAINAGSPEQAKAMAPPRKPPKKAKGEGKGKGDKTES